MGVVGMERTLISVVADDPVSQAGMLSSFRPRPEVLIVDADDDRVAVAVVVADTVDEGTLQTLRSLHRRHCPALLVVRAIDDAALAAAVEAGMAGLIRRADATPERLAHAVCSIAKGDGTVPPDLLGRLLAQVGRVQRQVLSAAGVHADRARPARDWRSSGWSLTAWTRPRSRRRCRTPSGP